MTASYEVFHPPLLLTFLKSVLPTCGPEIRGVRADDDFMNFEGAMAADDSKVDELGVFVEALNACRQRTVPASHDSERACLAGSLVEEKEIRTSSDLLNVKARTTFDVA